MQPSEGNTAVIAQLLCMEDDAPEGPCVVLCHCQEELSSAAAYCVMQLL